MSLTHQSAHDYRIDETPEVSAAAVFASSLVAGAAARPPGRPAPDDEMRTRPANGSLRGSSATITEPASVTEALYQLSVERKLQKLGSVVFGRDSAEPPLYCFQVHFPRLEVVLSGTYRNELCDASGALVVRDLAPGECLFVPANCWNRPVWEHDVTVLTFLFGARQLGLSKSSWCKAANAFQDVSKQCCPLPAQSPLHAIIRAISETQDERSGVSTCHSLLTQAVIEYAAFLIRTPASENLSHSKYLFHNIWIYLQENFHKQITRDSVADRFHVSPNYLSKIFAQHGKFGFSETLSYVRVERAKFMLKRYPFRIDEIANRCGFSETNYFCRVFKKHVGRTPTEYRVGQ